MVHACEERLTWLLRSTATKAESPTTSGTLRMSCSSSNAPHTFSRCTTESAIVLVSDILQYMQVHEDWAGLTYNLIITSRQ